jgi:hypothetical protein
MNPQSPVVSDILGEHELVKNLIGSMKKWTHQAGALGKDGEFWGG